MKTFKLMTPCSSCFKNRKFCERVIPCCQCESKGKSCSASSTELVARARAVYKSICKYEYVHNDYVLYALHLQATFYGIKSPIFRTEVKDISCRIMQADRQHGIVTIPNLKTAPLPAYLQEMVQLSNCYKIESMDSTGEFFIQSSPNYSINFISPDQVMGYSKRYSVFPRLVDSIGCTEHDAAFKMWLESVRTPGQCMVYKGYCIWRDMKQLIPTTIFVSSCIVSMSQILTVTCVEPGV